MARKMSIGIATIFPVAWFLFFLVYVLAICLSPWKPTDAELGRVLMVNFGCVLFSLGLLIYYVQHVRHNDAMPAEKKSFWIKAFLMGAIVLMPVYWYRYIMRQST